jgi:hypothetical protein
LQINLHNIILNWWSLLQNIQEVKKKRKKETLIFFSDRAIVQQTKNGLIGAKTQVKNCLH